MLAGVAHRAKPLTAVGKLPGPIVQEDHPRIAGRLEMPVGDDGVEVAIVTDIAQRHVPQRHRGGVPVGPVEAEGTHALVDLGALLE